MTPHIATFTIISVMTLVIIVQTLSYRDKQERERRAAKRERDIRNRRAYDLNKRTRWNG